jgi:co-chaperonin GroES (HSP10)
MIQPTKKKVVVQLIQKEKVTSSGIILSSADPAEANRGNVLAIGPNVTMVSVNDIVLPNWNNASEKFEYENQNDLYIIDEKDIVAVFS